MASKKNSKRVGRNKHTGKTFVISSKAYGVFEEAALWQLKKYKVHYAQPVHIHYEFCMKGRMDTDTDNMIASINDVLQKAGIIKDDALVIEGSFKKSPGHKDFSTEIIINNLKK